MLSKKEEIEKAKERLVKQAVTSSVCCGDYPNCICMKKDLIIALNYIEQLEQENKQFKINLKKVHNRYNNKKETLDDLLNYYPNFKMKFKIIGEDKERELEVVETKYYEKLVDIVNKQKKKLEDKIEELKEEFKNYIVDVNCSQDNYYELSDKYAFAEEKIQELLEDKSYE